MEKIQIILEAVENAKSALANASKQIDDITKAAQRQQGVVARLNGFLQEHDKLLLGIKVTATAVVAAMVLMGRHAIETGDKLNKQANALGTTTEKLSTYAFAADLANVSQEEFSLGLSVLNRSLAEAQTAGSNAAKRFAQLGIDPSQLKDPIAAIDAIADAFANSEGAAEKAVIAQELFGRGSRNFIAFLNQGSAALHAQADEARAFGLEIKGPTAEASEKFNDNMTRLKAILQGTVNTLVADALPTLISLQQTLINNKEIVADLFKLVGALSVVIIAATAAWKAYVIAGQLAAAVMGLGAVKNAKDYLAAIQLVASTPWAAYTAGAAGAVAIIVAGVEAWKAYKAAQEEALSTKRLTGANENLKESLIAKINDLTAAGKIAESKAKELRARIDAAFAETKRSVEVFVPGETRTAGRQNGAKETVEVIDKKSAAEQSSLLRGVAADVIALDRAQREAADRAAGKKVLTPLPDENLLKAQAAAAAEVAKAQNDTTAQLFKNSLDQQETLLKQSLDRRQVSIEAFSAEQTSINEKRFAIETDFAQREAESQRQALQSVLDATKDPTTRAKAEADLLVNAENLNKRLAEIEQRRFTATLALENQIAAQRKQAVAQQVADVEQKQQAAQTKLQEVLDRNQALQARGFITNAENIQRERVARAEYIGDLVREQEKLQAILTTVEALNAASPGLFSPEEVGNLRGQIAGLQGQQTAEQGKQPLDPASFTDNFAQVFGELKSQAQITATSIAGTFKDVFNSAIGSISQGITGLIVGTQTWGQALRQIGLSILTSVVGAIVQIGVRWIATQLLMAVAGKAIMAASLATSAPIAAASAAMWAPAALAATIATYGAAAGLGSAALISATAAISPILSAFSLSGLSGFNEGGLVPGAPSTSDNRLAMVATGEYIFDAQTVAQLGAGWFAGLHQAVQSGNLEGFFASQQRASPRVGRLSFADGGLVGAAAASATNINIGVLDSRNQEREFMRRDGIQVLIDELSRRGNSLAA